MVGESEPAQRQGQREYKKDDFVVTWEPALCIHSAECSRSLPSVFDTKARPWISLDGAEGDRIEEVVNTCPSAALKFKRVPETS